MPALLRRVRAPLAAAAVAALAAGGLAREARALPAGPPARTAAHAAAAAPAPRCFGAAARVPGRPCANPALRTRITPSPDDAPLVPDAPCTPLEHGDVLDVCGFGAAPPAPGGTVALVGDSHASHWRAALAVAARRQGWRGVSLTRSSCPFSRARPRIAPEAQGPCRRWNQEVPAWLAAHPQVHTVFLSAHAGARVRPARGRHPLETKVAGYTAAWATLPASVRRVVVLRDVPTRPLRTTDCLDAALAARRAPLPTCAVRRAGALLPDPGVVAARRLRSPRVQVVDLTPFMCGPRECYPVVGGVLVNKDSDHLSRAFSATLGPHLLSRVLRLRRAAGGAQPARPSGGSATGPAAKAAASGTVTAPSSSAGSPSPGG